ncbi:MAG: M23 family metallopeptidase [Actinomycetota bacterium]
MPSVGHRGIDYGASSTPVSASNEGTVKFAGPVAGDGLFVTISHAGGLETTDSFLSFIHVSMGDDVTKGRRIADSGHGHLGTIAFKVVP